MDTSNLMLTLSKTDINLLQELVDKICSASRVTVLKPATNSLVMMGVKDSVQEVPFYLGEVLITQCVVKVNDRTGYGFAMGDDPERAYNLAVLEATLRDEDAETGMISEFLAGQAQTLRDGRVREYAAVSQTRVRFDSMEEV